MRSLRVKILALAALLVLLTQVGTIGVVLYTTSGVAQQAIRDNLVRAGDRFDLAMRLRIERLRGTLPILARDADLMTALAQGDEPAIVDSLARISRRAEAALAAVLDDEGRVLAATETARALTVNVPLPAAGADSLRIPATASGATVELLAIALPASGPRPGRWLALGFPLDGQRARQIAALSALDALLVSAAAPRNQVIGVSLEQEDPRQLAAALERAIPEGSGLFRLSLDHGEYFGVRRPLLEGDTGADVILLQSLDRALAYYKTVRLAAMALGGLALVLALAGAAVVARAITRPIRELAQAAMRIRQGDYSEPVDVRADGELKMLATAINTMQQGIADREHHITYRAQFDTLTGLPNRLLALERLEQATTHAATGGECVSVLMIDLGNFATTTAALGHEIGNALLAQAAERLRASVDARHTVARLEGDQFLIVLEGVPLEQAREVAEDLLRLLEVGLCVHDVNISVNAAIGIAACPHHARAPEQLLLRASVARDDARAAQQGIHVYQDGREERRVRQLAILGDLRRAVRQDELKLYLQPKVSLPDGRICGAEALVRWDHPTFGWLPPTEFIGVAEQFGNISLVTRWALAAAVRECRLWVEEGLDLAVAVNLSGRDLLDRNLPVFILELLRDHDLDPRYLTLEVTEEALVRDFARTTLVLQCLRDLGTQIAIDDFGTGYSSLSQIKNLPVDEVKIDRAFVMELPDNRADAAIVRSALTLAHDLGLSVVAEGVETEAALRWLATHGCENAQGFLISRPMPAESFVAWVRQRSRITGATQENAPEDLVLRAG